MTIAGEASPSEPAKRQARSDKAITASSSKRTTGQQEGREDDADMAELRQRLAFLCHDLRTFAARTDAARRLDASVYPHFLGPPYLTDAQAKRARACTLADLREGATVPKDTGSGSESKTLVLFLEKRMAALVAARRTKGERGDGGGGGGGSRDFVLCTSHDLAPLLQEACGFSKEHFETRAFKDAYKRWEKEVRKAEKKRKGAA